MSVYHPDDCYNADEFELQYRIAPNSTIAVAQLSGSKKYKACITCLASYNATGKDKLPLRIIDKARRSRAFEMESGKGHGFDYSHNAKAWMKSVLFMEWLHVFDRHVGRKS